MVEFGKNLKFLEAASTGQIANLQALVDSDGSIDDCDTIGKSALWLAIERGNDVAVETLLKAGANVNKTYQSRRTPLMFAVDKGRTNYVRVMLEAGAKLDCVDSYGMSAMMIAAQRGNTDILQMLVVAGANLHLRDIRGKTGLMVAVEENSCECLKYLIEAGADTQIKDFQGNSPLMTAVFQNCKECIQTLVQVGASVNEVNRSGKTILMIAVERQSSVLQVLIQNGANLNATDNRHETAIMMAARAGQVSSVSQLVQAGANLNLAEFYGQTALMMAADVGSAACTACLIQGGARQDLQDTNGRSALMLAAAKGHHACVQVLLQSGKTWKDMKCRSGKTALIYAVEAVYDGCVRDLATSIADLILTESAHRRDSLSLIHKVQPDAFSKCVQILLEAGASPVLCDKVGMSPLMYGARVDKLAKCFQLLVDAGADIHMADKSGLTALGHAAYSENWEYLRRLVDAGTSVNTSSITGETPLLYLAKKSGSTSVYDNIVYLLDHMADVNVQDQKGMTPLMWAAKSTTGTDVMSLLIRHGAVIDMTDQLGFSALHHTLGPNNELLGNVRLLLDSGANPNIRTAEGKSAVSLIIRGRNQALLELLLKYNTQASIDWKDFCYLLQTGDKKMLQHLVLHGLFTSPVAPHENIRTNSSILMTALNTRSLAMAKFLLAVGYLNHSDTTYKKIHSPGLSGLFFSHRMAQSNASVITFLNDVYSQPWPLVKLCFIAVSSNLGSNPGREDRVRRSGLPDRLQRMLLFQEPIARLCVQQWDSIPLCFHSDDYERLPKPRPLLFYWPFGRDLTPCDCSECSQAGFRFTQP